MRVPPVFIVDAGFHLGNLSYSWDDVLKYHEVEANIDVENRRYEAEKQFNKSVFLQALSRTEGLKHFDNDDEIDQRTY